MGGQTKIFFTTPAIHTPDYAMKNLFAGMVGFLLNFASLSCVAISGPTTYVTIGSLNKIPVAILGYYIFDSVISQETWFFIQLVCVEVLFIPMRNLNRHHRHGRTVQSKKKKAHKYINVVNACRQISIVRSDQHTKSESFPLLLLKIKYRRSKVLF